MWTSWELGLTPKAESNTHGQFETWRKLQWTVSPKTQLAHDRRYCEQEPPGFPSTILARSQQRAFRIHILDPHPSQLGLLANILVALFYSFHHRTARSWLHAHVYVINSVTIATHKLVAGGGIIWLWVEHGCRSHLHVR